MIKQILLGTLLLVPCASSANDWIDDLTGLVGKETIQQHRAEKAVQSHVEKDEQEIRRLEAMEKDDKKEGGVNATIRGGTYKVQLSAARVSLAYHKKALDYIKSLPRNENERLQFIEKLTTLKTYETELADLKKDYNNASGVGNSVKSGGLVAAKEAQIVALKGRIKGSIIIS